MLGYELDFNSCAIRDGFCKSSHICGLLIIIIMQIINNYACGFGLLIIITKVYGKAHIMTLVSNMFLFLAAKCTYSGDESSII